MHTYKGFYLLVSVQFFLQSIEEGRAASKSPRLVYFLSMSQQAVSADIIPNSAVGIFFPKTEGTKRKAARVLIS